MKWINGFSIFFSLGIECDDGDGGAWRRWLDFFIETITGRKGKNITGRRNLN